MSFPIESDFMARVLIDERRRDVERLLAEPRPAPLPRRRVAPPVLRAKIGVALIRAGCRIAGSAVEAPLAPRPLPRPAP